MKDNELRVTIGAFKRIFPKLCEQPENMEFEPTGNPYEVIIHYKDKSIDDIRFQYHGEKTDVSNFYDPDTGTFMFMEVINEQE